MGRGLANEAGPGGGGDVCLVLGVLAAGKSDLVGFFGGLDGRV